MSLLEPHQTIMRVRPGGYIALAVLVLMLAGCTNNYGYFTKSAEVDLAFRQGDRQPGYMYFYAGRDTMPYAIIGIDPTYTVPSRYWIPFEPEPDTLKKMTGNMYWKNRYNTIFTRMDALGLPFVGPQAPDGRQADP